MEHDIVIKGGTVIDGTGAPGRVADVAVTGDRIAEVGEGLTGRRTLDATGQVVTPVAALALVAGANLGSAINPVLEGAGGTNPAARRLPVGNLVNRLIGCIVVLQPSAPIFVNFFAGGSKL